MTRFIRSSEKRRILDELEEQFGIKKLPFLLFETGREKIRGYSGHLSKEEIAKFIRIANVDIIGSYLIKNEEGYRLSFDFTTILRDQITKNIVEIDEKEYDLWMHGLDLNKEVQQGIVVIKFKTDFLGCGKSNGKKIFNFVPKDRRLKTKL